MMTEKQINELKKDCLRQRREAKQLRDSAPAGTPEKRINHSLYLMCDAEVGIINKILKG